MRKTLYRASAMVVIALSMILASPTIENSAKHLSAFEKASEATVEKNNTGSQIVVTIKAQSDNRAERLARFFASQNSPLTPHAADFVRIADEQGFDWKFLPAIAGLESTYGQAVPANSYNPYGWNNGKMHFTGWVHATEMVAVGIRQRYVPAGVVTPAKVGPRYAATPTWAARVTKNMQKIAQVN